MNEPEFEPWDGCTCGPQGPAHVYVSIHGTEVVHRPWCDRHPADCTRPDCCATDQAEPWDITAADRRHLSLIYEELS